MTVGELRWPAVFPADDLIRLDRLSGDDADGIVAAADTEAKRWLPLPDPYRLADAEEFLRTVDEGLRDGTRLTFAIRSAADGLKVAPLLGTASLQLHGRSGEGAVGYMVAPPARRRGVAVHATRLVAAYGLHVVGLHRVEILVQVDNLASRAVARASGAEYEGVRRNGIRFVARGDLFDAAVYAFIPNDLPPDVATASPT